MRRDPTLQVAGSVGAMNNWRFIALHAVVAAAFMFLLQRYGMNASLDTSLLWALGFGACAAGLAYKQFKR
jgi:hypothetical protein